MVNVDINAPLGHVETTGVAFRIYANRYRDAALVCHRTSRGRAGFDPAPYYLLCLSLELHLKSFIWINDGIAHEKIKKKYGHDIEKLWSHSKIRGINKFAKTTPLRDRVISLVGPYYKKRQFNYLDLDMVFHGFKSLRSEPIALTTLSKLTTQLGRSLRTPVLDKSQPN